MAKKYKEKHFKDTSYIYCENELLKNKNFFNCNIHYWEQGLVAKVEERFHVRVETLHMGDVIKSQLISANGVLSMSLKRSEKDSIINTTHCYLTGFQPAIEYGKRAEASGFTCTPEVRHVDDKS